MIRFRIARDERASRRPRPTRLPGTSRSSVGFASRLLQIDHSGYIEAEFPGRPGFRFLRGC
jgi:hypothetical protein